MNRRRHPSQGGPTPADIERAKRAARHAAPSGLGNIRPIRHLRAVYDWAEDDDLDADRLDESR
jgi:hypothetical protein